MLNFESTVSALVYSLVHERCAGAAPTGRFIDNDVVRFVVAQQGRTPDYLRLLLRVVALVFDAWPLLMTGKPFHRLAPEARGRQIEAWRNSRLGPLRNFIRYYEGLAVFGWYSLCEERAVSA
jgi:hypothetical protein